MASGGGGVRLKAGTRPPWVGLAAAVWVQMAAGNAYTFPLYSPAIKAALGYTQQQLAVLGVAKDVGENFGVVAGVLCNSFPPWVVLLVGAAFCFVGYGALWLAVSGAVVAMPYCLLWIVLAMATNSNAWFLTAVLVTNMRNFPLRRGVVAGLLKGYIGVSAALFTQVFSGVLHRSPTSLLLLLATGLPTICLATMYFVRPCTPATLDAATTDADTEEDGHFAFTQAVSVVLAVYLVTTTVLGNAIKLSDATSYTLFIVTVLLLLAPLAIPVKMTLFRSSPRRRSTETTEEPLLIPPHVVVDSGGDGDEEESDKVDLLLAEGKGAVVRRTKRRRPRRGEDFEFSEALVKADFWLLFVGYFIGVGTGVTVLNNLAQDWCCCWSTLLVPRPIWMALTQTVLVVAYLCLAYTLGPAVAYACTATVGLCYGVQFSVMIPTTSELFGLKNFGLFYNLMSLANPLGAALFSGELTGRLYDEEAARQQHSGGVCLGPGCFRAAFVVLAGACSVGTAVSLVLAARIQPVYMALYSGGSFRLPNASQQH
ncbi:hypothetical protein OsJ_26629 [Oryza sativa Japonica Group]|uniref:Uncharacterized protein n=1 Tax=Oryza sativa subsp. japonica TaxID=39947 RepID=A3BR79_ORYSJ|nr:hypothetical protein OsJ_26629 [Oryza sativa Japonica Group]